MNAVQLLQLDSMQILQSQSINTGAIIQGVVAAVAIIGVAIIYFDRLSSVSNQLERLNNTVQDISDSTSEIGRISESIDEMSTNVSKIDEDIQHISYDLDHANFAKLETYLDQELSQNYSSTPRPSNSTNSVEYSFDDLDITATVSYVGDPDLHASLEDSPDGWSEATVFNIEFDKEIDTNSVAMMLAEDDDLVALEQDLFDQQARIEPVSPFTLTCGVSSSDFGKIAEWVTIALEKVEEYEKEIRRRSDQFDENLKGHNRTQFRDVESG